MDRLRDFIFVAEEFGCVPLENGGVFVDAHRKWFFLDGGDPVELGRILLEDTAL